MNTCKECKHWTRGSSYDKPWEGRCSSDKFVESQPAPKDGLQYWDYEGYSAGFTTGEDFGCIHWKPQ